MKLFSTLNLKLTYFPNSLRKKVQKNSHEFVAQFNIYFDEPTIHLIQQ